MDVGKPRRIYRVEPLKEPVPREAPVAPPEKETVPAEPVKAPAK